ncbi:hypothetical protein SAY87_025404 [Trapa incisa]|uniref:Uncharacterized protein n=2 Tax=Trapa TaxID=22665 RepID=A0AAN7LP23_TRANT|nr:hypothetical protein SAY87_025404 [Trapa incisa]KAK4788679.1 hypothetical protein SAY86_019998 [Trapa natans]
MTTRSKILSFLCALFLMLLVSVALETRNLDTRKDLKQQDQGPEAKVPVEDAKYGGGGGGGGYGGGCKRCCHWCGGQCCKCCYENEIPEDANKPQN